MIALRRHDPKRSPGDGLDHRQGAQIRRRVLSRTSDVQLHPRRSHPAISGWFWLTQMKILLATILLERAGAERGLFNELREGENHHPSDIAATRDRLIARQYAGRSLAVRTPQKLSPALLALAIVGCLLCAGCTLPVLRPAAPTDFSFTVPRPRSEVFEAILVVAQSMNLKVDVLEKDSGFIQFSNAALSAIQLDTYASYPYVVQDSLTPIGTFADWNTRSLAGGRGSVTGKVSLSFVLTPKSASTVVTLHSSWIASNSIETHQVASLEKFERDFEKALLEALGPDASGRSPG